MVRKGFIVKATSEQRLETGEVMNPTNTYSSKAVWGETAYHEQFEEGWCGWSRGKEKKEAEKQQVEKVKLVTGLRPLASTLSEMGNYWSSEQTGVSWSDLHFSMIILITFRYMKNVKSLCWWIKIEGVKERTKG